MTHRILFGALLLGGTFACTDPLARMDRMTGAISVGEQYCNWTPTSSRTSFDITVGFEMKEAVGIQLRVSPAWSDDPYTQTVAQEGLDGIMTAVSLTPDLAQVFSGPDGSFAVLARKPGAARIEFQLAGHPGTLIAPVTIVPSDQFVNREEVGPVDEEESSSGGSSSSSGANSDAGAQGGD